MGVTELTLGTTLGNLGFGEIAFPNPVRIGDTLRSETEVVSNDPTYRTNYGKIHYLQHLVRDHPLVMRPGQSYRLVVNFEPDIVHTEN